LKKKIAATAILMCAVMVLVAGAPLVTADTHHIVKGAQGPRASAVSWIYTPADTGIWNGHIVNSGLRSLVVDVNDITTGAASSILHQRIRFAAYPSNTLDTANATMAKGHTYNITATPNGARGTQCTLDDVFTKRLPPVAMFTLIVDGATVTVDGSASYDPNVGGTITAWGWEWDDGSTGTGMTASHTYTASGTYTITLTVLSSSGMWGSSNQAAIVSVADSAPVPMFAYTTTGLTVSVDASASTDDHGIVSYDWNWGDGSALGSGVKTTHTYAASGTYPVTLTVTDTATQSASLTMDVVVVDNPPVALFTYTTADLTLNVDASTSSDDVGILSYAWDFGDLTTGTGKLATHTYAAPGAYSVTLTVTDTIGQTGMLTKLVTFVDDPPVASFTATVSGYSVTVTSTSTDDHGIASYSWNWGDGSAAGTGATATHTYTAVPPLLRTITLTVTDTIGQTNSVSQTVTLKDNAPVAAFSISYNAYTVTFDASTSTDDHGIVTYAWNFGDGNTGTGKTTTHTYVVPPQTYSVMLTVTDTVDQTGTLTQPVNFADNPPVAAFTWTVSGYSVTVTSTSTDDHGITSYSWNWNDGSAAGTGATATHTYTAVPPLLRSIGLTVTDTVGQTNTVTNPVTLQDNAPAAAFTSAVSGYTVTVTSTSTDDHGIASYSWNWNDGSAAGTGATATHTYTAVPPLLRSIGLTVTDTVGQTNTATNPVTLQDNAPAAAFTSAVSGYTVTVTSTSTDDHGIASYSWNWNDGSAAGTGATATHTYTAVPPLLRSIGLTVTDTVGQTNTVINPVTLQDNPPVAAFTATPSGYSVTVTSTSTDDHGIASYSWNWGDGSALGTGATATHTYTGITSVASLTKTIALTVTDTVGQTNSKSNTVTLQDNPPVAAFTSSVVGYTVTMTSTSTDDHGIASYSWNWNDGSAAGTGATATHTYTAVPPLLRSIGLTVTDTVGQTNTVTNPVTLQDNAPVASFTSAVSGYTVTVTSTSTDDHGIASYSWNWNDGSAAGTGATATHTYTAVPPLLRSIGLTVTDTVGQTNTVINPVTLQDNPPVAAFTATPSGYSVTVTSTSTDDHGIASYSWNWGDGSALGTGATATHTYTGITSVASLTKTIALTVTDTVGQTNSKSNTVTLQDNPPVAAFTIAPPVGLAVSVDASASTDDHGIASYAWNWGDSTTGTGVTATHTYGASGTYTITLIVTDTVGQPNSVSHPVIVSGGSPPPVASFTATVSGGFTVSVNGAASSGGTGALSYAWNYGDMITQNGLTASHSYVTTGTYTITLTVTDSLGQMGTATKSVDVVNPNPPPFTFSLYGTTFASDGVTPLGGCMVSITDVRTGTTLIGTISFDDGSFIGDISPLYQLPGDTIVVNAIGPAGQTGSGSGVVVGTPYLGIDVTLI
jgi:PKD repeat protein